MTFRVNVSFSLLGTVRCGSCFTYEKWEQRYE